MIRAEGLTKQFLCGFWRRPVHALAGLDLGVPPGGGRFVLMGDGRVVSVGPVGRVARRGAEA